MTPLLVDHVTLAKTARHLMELYQDTVWYWEVLADPTDLFWERVSDDEITDVFDACIQDMDTYAQVYHAQLINLQRQLTAITQKSV